MMKDANNLREKKQQLNYFRLTTTKLNLMLEINVNLLKTKQTKNAKEKEPKITLLLVKIATPLF